MKKINLLSREKVNEVALIRFGYIGDLITAIQIAKNYNFKLVAYENKRKFFFNEKNTKNYKNLLKDLSIKYNFELLYNTRIKDLKKYKKVYLFLQSGSLFGFLFFKIIRYLYNFKNFEILNEGSNYFHLAVLSQNNNVLKLIKNKIKNSKKRLKIALCWKGKEIQKNLSIHSIRRLLEIFESKKIKLILLSDSKIDITGNNVLNLSGKINLIDAMKNIDNSDIVISVDTGLLHYAVSKNKLCIALVAHRYALSLWYPFNSKTFFIGDIFTNHSKNNFLNQRLVLDELKDIFN